MEDRRYSSWILERIVIGDAFRLRIGTNTFGRHSSSNIRAVEATFISRHHAIFDVSENGESVTIKDVSSNGIYVNEVKYDKATVPLKNNDLIGIGVSPADVPNNQDIITLPIYQLKYLPMSNFRIPPDNNLPHTNSTKSDIEINSVKNIKCDIKKETENNNDPTAKNGKITAIDEIYEISDDDELDVVIKPKTNQTDMSTQQKPINGELRPNDNQQKLLLDLNKHIDNVIKNELPDDNDFINPSQITEQKKLNDVILSEDKLNCEEISLNNKSNTTAANNEKRENLNKPMKPINSCDNVNKNQPIMHMPIISNIKKERIRSVSADIQNIFGDIEDDDVLQNAIKEINPLVYNEISVSKKLKPIDDPSKILTNGDIINLTDDEDLDGVEAEELGTIIPIATENNGTKNTILEESKNDNTVINGKESGDGGVIERTISPNIFDFSLDNSKEEEESFVQGKVNNEEQKTAENFDNIDKNEYTKYITNNDKEEDIEDIMFSQVIINDMKAELQNELNDQESLPLHSLNIENHVQNSKVIVKQEPGLELFASIPKELENSCWIISDSEDYDEELETKVKDWSSKIFSQSFNLSSQHMSQVYEREEPDKNDGIEEDDCFEEDNLSFLEDDIDGVSDIYNSFHENDVVKKVEELTVEIKSEWRKTMDELNNKPAEEKDMDNEQIKNYDIKQMGQSIVEDKSTVKERRPHKEKSSVKEKSPTKEKTPVRERSPVIETKDSDINNQSPVVRVREIRKSKPVIESPSSSEDELDIKNNKLSNDIIDSELDKAITRLPPPIIKAPALPKHKGKLRGVSAVLAKSPIKTKTSPTNKILNALKSKMQQERFSADLKKKWMEKPSISKKRDKEHKTFIKERRKNKLKELAERKKSSSREGGIKRKLSTEDNEHKPKVAKVKLTSQNRGAFLASSDAAPSHPPPSAHSHKTEKTDQFKIPKVTKKLDEVKNTKKDALTRSVSVDSFDTFSQQISKPDILLFKRQNSDEKPCDKSNQANKTPKTPPLRRHSVTDAVQLATETNLDNKTTPTTSSSTVCKEAIAARAIRTTNKITFASMEKNIVESEENKRKLSVLNAKSTTPLSSFAKPNAKKKTVRFNDTPIIHYIERVTGACRKINNKDVMPMTNYKARRLTILDKYPIIDHTNKIISNILCWSNEWLKTRNAAADAASVVIYPMPSYFNSFEHYQSIIFPLMKLEFVSTLEREYNSTQNVKKFKVSLEYASLNDDRIMLVTKFANNQNKEAVDSTLYDLVILESDKRGPQIFAFVVANRKGGGCFATIVYEIIAKNFTIEYFKAIKEFNVRPVMDKVRVHFGAFNAVYQLESTPLFEKIINPIELLKCRPPPKKKIVYRGFDKLNDKQKQVLLSTYIKVIDESTPNMTLIQGPPGTGKSCVITNLVLQSLYGDEVRYLDKKILICAQSNTAVDVIAAKLYDVSMRMRVETRFRVIRYGMLNKIHPNVRPIALQKVVEHDQLKKLQARNGSMHLENKENLKTQILEFEAQVADMSARNIKGTVEEDRLIEKKRQLQLMRNILNGHMRPEDERSLFSWYLSNANIVCATLSSCVNLWQYTNFFDICIIDEATQCTEPWTLLPLKFGINSLVLVGDTQQLPATILSKKASELGLGTSMFTRIQQCLDSVPCTSAKGTKGVFTTPNNILHSLQTQYRMHPDICRWPNQYFYRNELINAKSTMEFNKSPLVPFSILSLSYTQNNSGINGKITNNLEADFVAKLLKALDGFIPNKYNSYGVITPYAHHRATLESSIRNLGLSNIMVNTIDSYQGLEKDVIIISNARTSGIGFLSNPQRLNVALTRSKKCLILCGNFKSLESVPSWRCLLENARERKLYHEISANCIEDMQGNVIEKILLKNQKQLTNTTTNNERM